MNNRPLTIEHFCSLFSRLTYFSTWEVEGFLDKNNVVHPIDHDTKVISTVFERFCSPVIYTIAKYNSYKIEKANQTTYPDFTLTHSATGHRIALDVKTTYQQKTMVLTLGSYKSYLVSNTKNILHPYDTYHDHWIIGFIYEQKPTFPEYDLSNMPRPGAIECPYRVKTIFIREKYAITGLRAASGNTTNIGSIPVTQPDRFQTECGPFMFFRDGKGACDHYWKGYETYMHDIRYLSQLLNHPDFQQYHPDFEKFHNAF